MNAQDFTDEYFAVLQKHLDEPSETQLAAAAELGKKLLLDGVPAETIAEIHGDALGRLAELSPEITLLESVRSISEPLMELLMTYGLAFREREVGRRRIQAKLRESEQQLRLITDNVSALIAYVDSEQRYRFVNPAYAQWLGRSVRDIIGMPVRKVVGEAAYQVIVERIEAVRSGEKVNFDAWLPLPDRTERYVSACYVPHFGEDEQVQGFFVLVADITERKQAEDARQRLEDESRQLEAQLAHVNRLSTMGEMASVLAHGINQPLTAIANYAAGCVRLLAQGQAGQDDLSYALAQIDEQARRAGQITNRLKRFIAKTTPQLSRLCLNELVQQVAQLLESDIHAHQVTLELELEPSLPAVQVDGIQIQQVLVNLVRNGLEAMDEIKIGRRRISIVTSSSPGGVRVSVCDSGPAVAPELADKVFEAYFTTKPGGLGIGLNITQRIIETHSSRLSATANPDGGMTFQFTLPIET